MPNRARPVRNVILTTAPSLMAARRAPRSAITWHLVGVSRGGCVPPSLFDPCYDVWATLLPPPSCAGLPCR